MEMSEPTAGQPPRNKSESIPDSASTNQDEPDRSPASDLLQQIFLFVKRFIVLRDDHQAIAIALWVLHTHAFEAADSTPYLLITSPEKRSGKSRLLEVLNLLVARGWHVAGVSEAVLFRKIEKVRPTLLLDEVDAIFSSFAEKTEPLRALINAGSRRGGQVSRCVGKGHDVEDFSVFCPKCLAGIATGRLPETIRDRSIPIRLQRRLNEKIERFHFSAAKQEADALVLAISAWAEVSIEQLRNRHPDLPTVLNDRSAEGWEPLLAIAEEAGDAWPEKAARAAEALCADVEIEDDSFGVQLLADLERFWEFDKFGSRLFSHEICAGLNLLDDAPWKNWGRSRAMSGFTPRDLGRELRRYEIRSKSMRVGDQNAKGYEFEQFQDVWARYVPNTESPEAS